MAIFLTGDQLWLLKFSPLVIFVFLALYILKNLSSFRKQFQAMPRNERASDIGKLKVQDLKKKYVIRSIVVIVVAIVIYILLGIVLK